MRTKLVAALGGLLALTLAQQTTWSQVPPFSVDHFLLYKLSMPKGAAKFTSVNVTLADQFESRGVVVVKDRLLGTPTDKNGESVIDLDTHLVGYKTKDLRGQPKHAPRIVEVANQFGTVRLRTKPAKRLLVPASKGLAGFLPAPSPSGHDVDHYRCYKVTPASGPRFAPILGVAVVDQFQNKRVDVVKPFMLCNPAEKTHQAVVHPIQNPADHLLCYKIRPSQGAPKHIKTNVFLTDQFGQLQRTTIKETELCVPSSKLVIDPPPPPTPIPTPTYTVPPTTTATSTAPVPTETPSPTETDEPEETPTGPTPGPTATPFCGDGSVNAPGEQCDPPNPLDTDCDAMICTATCQIVFITSSCGDGCLRHGEQCEPPGSLTCPDNNPCSPTCQCPGPQIIDSFFDVFYRIEITGCPTPMSPPRTGSGPGRVKHGGESDPGDGRMIVPIEMVELTLTGSGATITEQPGGSDPFDPLVPPCMGGPGCSGGQVQQQSAGSYTPSDLMSALHIVFQQGPTTLVGGNPVPLNGTTNGNPIITGTLMSGTCIPLINPMNPMAGPQAFITIDQMMMSPN